MVDIVFDGSVSSNTLVIQSTVEVDAVIDDATMAAATATNLSTSSAISSYISTVSSGLESELFLLGGM